MNVFVIEYVISAYDGSMMVGVSSTLQKAVEHLENLYSKKEEVFVEHPHIEANGHFIYEYTLDDLDSFRGLSSNPVATYNGKGTKLSI